MYDIITIIAVIYAFGVGYVAASFKHESCGEGWRFTAASIFFAIPWPLFLAHSLVEKARVRAMKTKPLATDPQDPEHWAHEEDAA